MEAQLLALLVPYFLIFVRILAFLGTAPVLSLNAFPPQIKAAFALMCALAIGSSLHPVNTIPLTGGDWIVFVGKEVLIGAGLGYLTALVVLAAQMAGSALSIQVGFSFAQYVNPGALFTGGQIETLFNAVAGLLFFASGAYLLFFATLLESFRLFPVEQLTPSVPLDVVPVIVSTTALALRMALPILAPLLLAEIGLGLLARVVPQMNMFLVALPAKILLMLLLIAVTAPFLATLLANGFNNTAALLLRMLAQLGGAR